MSQYWLSVLIPTKYPDRFKKFYEALVSRTTEPSGIELVILEDGPAKKVQRADALSYFDETRLEYPAGATRSEQLQYCIENARGEFVWFANDDITPESDGWDVRFRETVRKFSEGIVLVWPNDGVFKQRLSIFPLLKKTIAAKLVDNLPYKRYKIDDTIHDVFPPRRRVYLDDVRMTHGDGKTYSCEPTAYQHDEQHYIQRVPQRGAIRAELRKLIPDYKQYKVFVAVPRYIKPATHEFYDCYFVLDRPDQSAGSFCTGQSPAKNRNIMIEQARNAGFTHIMFLDDDVEYNPDLIFKLLDHDVDCVTALYLKRDYPHEPVIFGMVQPDGWGAFAKLKNGQSGLIEVPSGGLGACLIKTSVFDKMDEFYGKDEKGNFKAKPYIRLGEIEADNWCDDTGFFRRMTAAGIKLHCDLDTFVGHTGKVSIWPNRVGDQWTITYRVGATNGTVQFPHPWSE